MNAAMDNLNTKAATPLRDENPDAMLDYSINRVRN
jgi:hypothetical protein